MKAHAAAVCMQPDKAVEHVHAASAWFADDVPYNLLLDSGGLQAPNGSRQWTYSLTKTFPNAFALSAVAATELVPFLIAGRRAGVQMAL